MSSNDSLVIYLPEELIRIDHVAKILIHSLGNICRMIIIQSQPHKFPRCNSEITFLRINHGLQPGTEIFFHCSKTWCDYYLSPIENMLYKTSQRAIGKDKVRIHENKMRVSHILAQ